MDSAALAKMSVVAVLLGDVVVIMDICSEVILIVNGVVTFVQWGWG